MSRREGAAGDERYCSFFFLLVSGRLTAVLPAPPARTSAQRESAAVFINGSIFSPSPAKLFLTNMSSLLVRLVQWDTRKDEGAVQWEAGKRKGGGLHKSPLSVAKRPTSEGQRKDFSL